MQSTRIEGSPEYLRIKLSIVNSNGTPTLNPVNVSEVLYLSEYQAVGDGPPLLMYRLSSVLAHGGTDMQAVVLMYKRYDKKL